ncbi:branched-chain amino acid transaminase [Rhodothermus marinus]|uniref:branched-chain amino acid transaminase n=1 Tax=Rhodothermus marinus TaxID=29549 RepID=UPI0012BA3C6A|nr:branched-chain amino acid transaminase [Rhodothermus marinus]BBM71011.1 branched chain amino acid aminotransferase [Rhodothermus marinus]BBM73990.1 branched chain amino acid aminotransferase [Rhodothermus marinus]
MDRHPIWFNGKLVPFEEAKIHVLSHVVHYGSSVFEGIRCYNTARGPAVFRLREHMRRLLDSARIYRMEVPYTLEELETAALETIRASGLKACYIRPVVFRGMGSLGVNPLNSPVEVFIAVWDWGAYLGDEALEQGVDVQVSTWNRMAPNTLPAMAKAGANYANAALVKMEAVLNGYSEGIMLSVDGYVAEGSGENLFLVRDGIIYTAPLTLSILPGITRDAVITLARDLGYTVIEQPIPREALYIADELFFTGTAAEITPIRSVDRYTIGQGRRGPVTEALQRAFFEIVREGKDPYGWLTFVEVPREASVSS